jgi:hypothetical protein
MFVISYHSFRQLGESMHLSWSRNTRAHLVIPLATVYDDSCRHTNYCPVFQKNHILLTLYCLGCEIT